MRCDEPKIGMLQQNWNRLQLVYITVNRLTMKTVSKLLNGSCEQTANWKIWTGSLMEVVIVTKYEIKWNRKLNGSCWQTAKCEQVQYGVKDSTGVNLIMTSWKVTKYCTELYAGIKNAVLFELFVKQYHSIYSNFCSWIYFFIY